MYRRITNWTSKGYIYLLSSLPFDELRRTFQSQSFASPSKRSNEGLCRILSDFCENEGAVDVLLSFLNHIRHSSLKAEQKPQNLEKLLTALNAEKSGDIDSAYNEETCIELHCLLIALLVGLGHSLTKYHAHKLKQKTKFLKEDAKAKEEIRMLAIRFWEYSRLLWAASLSHMFDNHIQVLLKSAFDEIGVKFEMAETYSRTVVFADMQGTDMQEKKTLQGHGDVIPVSDGGENGGGIDSGSELLPGYRFKHWVRILIGHFAALRLLTKENNGREKRATLIKHNYRWDNKPLDWNKIIRDLCIPDKSSCNPSESDAAVDPPEHQQAGTSLVPHTASFTKEDTEEVIKCLQGIIDAHRKDNVRCFGKSSSPTPVPAGFVLWRGCLHSEAVAMAVFMFLMDNYAKKTKLFERIKVRMSS